MGFFRSFNEQVVIGKKPLRILLLLLKQFYFKISQLSGQLKRALLAKRKSDVEATKLKTELVAKQKSWTEAVENEKKLQKLVLS